MAQWTAGQNYIETAEFVESIPFTETREYVQIVMRNADVYRQVYGPKRDEVNRAANMEADRAVEGDETRPAGAQGTAMSAADGSITGPAQEPARSPPPRGKCFPPKPSDSPNP